MARAAVIGEAVRTAGFALAGAVVLAAENEEEARAAWRSLPADVAVLVLTARAGGLARPGAATAPRRAARGDAGMSGTVSVGLAGRAEAAALAPVRTHMLRAARARGGPHRRGGAQPGGRDGAAGTA